MPLKRDVSPSVRSIAAAFVGALTTVVGNTLVFLDLPEFRMLAPLAIEERVIGIAVDGEPDRPAQVRGKPDRVGQFERSESLFGRGD